MDTGTTMLMGPSDAVTKIDGFLQPKPSEGSKVRGQATESLSGCPHPKDQLKSTSLPIPLTYSDSV